MFIAFAASGRFSVTSSVCGCGSSSVEWFASVWSCACAPPCMIKSQEGDRSQRRIDPAQHRDDVMLRIDPGHVAAGADREEAVLRRAADSAQPPVFSHHSSP